MPTVKKRKQWSIWRYEYAYDEYRKVEPMRQKVSDCLQGEEYVKSKEEYLRKTQWYKKHNDEYQAFVARATFYSKTSYALRVYEGLVTAGEPEILLPENGGMDFLRRYATVYKNDLHSLQVRLNRDQFTSGLRVMVAEPTADDKNPFVIKEYGASSFLRAYFVDMDGESVAKFVLMDESTMAFDIKTKSSTFKERLRVFGLDKDNQYYQCAITPDEWIMFDVDNPTPANPSDLVYPRYKGRLMNRIPVTWCGASSLSGSTFDIPVLLDVANFDLKLYNLDANYAQHLYQSSQETVFFTHTTKDFKLDNICYGSGAHNALPGEVDVKVVSVNGIGFSEQREYMTAVKEEISQRIMSVMSSKSHQSGTAIGIVQNAQTSPIRTIVETSAAAITDQLRLIAKWMDYTDEEVAKVSYTPSNEFAKIDTDLSAFIGLCRAVYEGAVPMLEEDLYRFAKMCGFVNSKREFAEFKKLHDKEIRQRKDDLAIMPDNQGGQAAD